MKPKILFRADGNEIIGAGHVMRCLALAEVFKEKGVEPVFISSSLSANLKNMLLLRGIKTVPIPENYALSEEWRFYDAMDGRSSIVGLIVDRYGIPDNYFKTIKAKMPEWTLGQIEDWGKSFEDVDVILNQNINAKNSDYAESKAGAVLTGIKYTLLRPEFRKRKPKPTIAPAVKKVLVTLGGSNQSENMLKILKVCVDLPGSPEINIIGSKSFSGELSQFVAGQPNIKVWKEGPDMAEIMSDMDLSITAAGSTLWELYYFGIPSLIYVLVDNQERNGQAAHDQNCSYLMGHIDKFDGVQLEKEVIRFMTSENLRKEMSARCQKAIDGNGAYRFLDIFMSLVNNSNKEKV